jgi:hypothetical protein
MNVALNTITPNQITYPIYMKLTTKQLEEQRIVLIHGMGVYT